MWPAALMAAGLMALTVAAVPAQAGSAPPPGGWVIVEGGDDAAVVACQQIPLSLMQGPLGYSCPDPANQNQAIAQPAYTAYCTAAILRQVVLADPKFASLSQLQAVGKPRCIDGFARLDFTPSPGGQQEPFFFKQIPPPPCTVQAFMQVMQNSSPVALAIGFPSCDYANGWARQDFILTPGAKVQPFFFRPIGATWQEQFDVSSSTIARACATVPAAADANLRLNCPAPPKPHPAGSGTITDCSGQDSFFIFGPQFRLCQTLTYSWDSSTNKLTESQSSYCHTETFNAWVCGHYDPEDTSYRIISENPRTYDFYYYHSLWNLSSLSGWREEPTNADAASAVGAAMGTCVGTDIYLTYHPATKSVTIQVHNPPIYTMIPLIDTCRPWNHWAPTS
jgi:hypothetical protein